MFDQLNKDKANIGIFFVLYNTATLFLINQSRKVNTNASTVTEVGTNILAATVGANMNFQNLTDNVTIVFRIVTTKNVRLF